MLDHNGALLWQGLNYPYQPATGEPWTTETLADFITANTPAPTPEPELTPIIVRVDKVRFKNELLTPVELIAFNRATKTVAAKLATEEAYDDPENAIYVQAEMLLDYLADIQIIELTHDKTILGVSQILVGLGVLTPERAEQVLANKTPSEAAPH